MTSARKGQIAGLRVELTAAKKATADAKMDAERREAAAQEELAAANSRKPRVLEPRVPLGF